MSTGEAACLMVICCLGILFMLGIIDNTHDRILKNQGEIIRLIQEVR